jgi:hypothetical protein
MPSAIWQLERLEDVERLADIIHTYRVIRAPSKEIACAIIKFVKEGDEGMGMERWEYDDTHPLYSRTRERFSKTVKTV